MHYGLSNVWQQGDWVTRAILLALTIMSVASWAVLLFKAAQLARLKGLSAIAEKKFWQAGTLSEGEAVLGRPVEGNPYRRLVEAAREAQESHSASQLEGTLGPDEWLSRALTITYNEELGRISSGLGVLASIGSTSPFVGLFGTVWGIYHALMAIGLAGQSSLEQVAGPVGESLVMTAFGLFVAIPAVLGYNAIARSNKGVAQKMSRFTHDLRAFFITGERRKPAGRHGAARPPAAVHQAPSAGPAAPMTTTGNGGVHLSAVPPQAAK